MRKAILLPAIFLTACSNYPASLPSIKPYKMDIQQGNVVTPKMMMQLRPGMSKAQVRFVMGTPLIADSFHANRWDYVYRMQKGGKVIEQRRVILDFENDQLKQVRGDVTPAGGDTNASMPASKEPVTLKSATGAAPKEKEKGMLDKLKFWKSDEPEATPKPAEKPVPEAQPATPHLPDIQEEKAEPLPPLMETPFTQTEPAPAKPEAIPLTKPEPKVEPKPQPKVEPRPEPKPEPTPMAKPAPKVEPSPAQKQQNELPPEEDPSYFERMLEKIGF